MSWNKGETQNLASLLAHKTICHCRHSDARVKQKDNVRFDWPRLTPARHSFIFYEENYLITEMKNIIQILPATPSYLNTAPVNRAPFTFTYRRCAAVVHI